MCAMGLKRLKIAGLDQQGELLEGKQNVKC